MLDDFALDCEEVDGVTVLKPSGDLDAYTAPLVREKLDEIEGTGVTHVVADLSAVRYVDVTGYGVLVGANRRFRGTHKGGIRLVVTDQKIRGVLQINGLDKSFGSGIGNDVAFYIHTKAEDALRCLLSPEDASASENHA